MKNSVAVKISALVVLLSVVWTGCVSSHEKALRYTLAGLNTASQGLEEWSAHEQERIVASSTSEAEARARILEHRAKRDHVWSALTVAYSALAVAALDPSTRNLATAVADAAEAYAALKALLKKE